MWCRAFAFVVVLMLLAACKERATTPADAGTAKSAERALCIAHVKLDATSAIDRELGECVARVSATPNDVDALVLLARAWVKKARNAHDPGFYLHADACAHEALALKPRYAPALHVRAFALLNAHRFMDARDLASDMLAHDRDDHTALGVLSDALLELGDVDGAVAASQRMMDLRPSLPSYARASYLLWLRGDEKGALESIRLAYDAGRGQSDREPTAWVLTEAAHIFRHRGDIQGALAGYEKALSEKPDYAPALVGKARCLLAAEKPSEANVTAAIAGLEKAFAVEPLVETAWLLGKAYAFAGRTADSERAFADVRRIGTQSDKRSLALFLATEGKAAADFDEAQRALDDDRKSRGGIYADDIEALIAWRKRDEAKARALMSNVAKLNTPDARLRVHRAVILGTPKLNDVLREGGAQDVLLRTFIGPPL